MALTKVKGSVWDSPDNNKAISPKDFGAVGDGITDDSSAIQDTIDEAIASNVPFVEPGGLTYKIDSPIDFTGLKRFKFLSAIDTSSISGSIAVTIGGFSESNGADWEFDRITDGSSLTAGPTPADPILRIAGMKSGTLKVKSCNYIQMYADAALSTGRSNAYNKIYLDGIARRLELASATGFSWITENTFYGGRVQELFILNGGGYSHNHNKFIDNTFESDDVNIVFDDCHSNKIYRARMENVASSPGVEFNNDSQRNSIEITWSGVTNPRNEFSVAIPVSTDSVLDVINYGNSVTTQSANNFNQTPIFQINGQSGWVGSSGRTQAADQNICIENSFAGVNGGCEVDFGFDLCTAQANRWIYLSRIIPVTLGDVIGWDFDYASTLIRPQVFCYDSNQRLLKDEGGTGEYFSQPSLTLNTSIGAYRPNTDLSGGHLTGAVARVEVSFIRIGIFTGAGGDFRGLAATIYTPSIGRALTESSAAIKYESITTISGAPTRGIFPKDTVILDYNASDLYINTAMIETELDADEVTTDTSIAVLDGSDTVNGDQVGILLDDGLTHWSDIASGGGTNTIVITDALPSNASTDNRIVFTRWAVQSSLP